MFFRCQHEQLVRSMQLHMAAPFRRSAFLSVICVMALVLIAQIRAGLDQSAFIWQFAMGCLAAGMAYRKSARRIILLSTLFGSGWAIALIAWGATADVQIAPLLVAVALAHTAYAASVYYFNPRLVLVFSSPVFFGSCFVLVHVLEPAAAVIALTIVALHAVAMFAFLQKSWNAFMQVIELDLEKQRLTAQLREQKEIAEKAVASKSLFLASASHDLRQPMHAISLYLGGLLEIDLSPRARRAIESAHDCAQDLIDMFRSLLDLARLDAQAITPNFGIFPVGPMLARIGIEFAPLAHSREVELRIRARNVNAFSDAVMVERIVMNFVSNAIRHAPKGKVLVACRTQGAMIRVSVHDTGKGIPESELQAIFRDFHRVDSAPQPDRMGGMGLGLAIVHRLSRALGVAISVRSKPVRGSMFAVDVPLARAPLPTSTNPNRGKALYGKLVVLIDDELPVLDATKFILENSGCSVVGAWSCRDALEALAGSERIPDAIICDYELNDELKGPSVIEVLRSEFNADIPALLVTGDTAGDGVEQLALAMDIPLLHKPLEPGMLTDSLAQLLVSKER